MKNKLIIDSWSKIDPDNKDRTRILNEILAQGTHDAKPRQVLRSYTRRFAVIAIAVLLVFSGAAFAVAHYLGGFDRLIGIIGEEQAYKLYPVEQSYLIADLLTDEGFRIEVVAVGIDANVVDFYFTLEDMVSNRLEGDIWIDATVFPDVDDVPWGGHEMFPEVIDRADDGIVTLRGREIFSQPIVDLELRFNLYHIAYNVISGEHDMGFDLSTLEDQAPAAWIMDTPILPVHLHDIELEVEGIEYRWYTKISSMGIVNGRLHIQQWFDTPLWRPPDGVIFRLVDPYGEYLMFYEVDPEWQTRVPVFAIDEYGNISNANNSHTVVYHEFIYEVDLARLSDYRLEADYIRGTHIDMSWWSATFTLGIV